MTAAFPTVKTKVADARDAGVAKEFGAAAAADDDNCDPRMSREAPQHPASHRRQAHLIGARRDLDESAVKIEKHYHAPARLYLGGYTIPIRGKGASDTLESGHSASTRSGLSIRISVKSERRFAAQR